MYFILSNSYRHYDPDQCSTSANWPDIKFILPHAGIFLLSVFPLQIIQPWKHSCQPPTFPKVKHIIWKTQDSGATLAIHIWIIWIKCGITTTSRQFSLISSIIFSDHCDVHHRASITFEFSAVIVLMGGIDNEQRQCTKSRTWRVHDQLKYIQQYVFSSLVIR